jgi:segregation and condensation protein A
MASELMYIKSKMMLPREEKEEKDPRMDLTDALLRYQAAKEGAAKMTKLYAVHSARMVKDTDEISIDRTFVADQQITSLCAAIRRLNSYQESIAHEKRATFTPMISKPIVPVELKIVGILKHLQTEQQTSLETLLSDAVSLPDMIAIFLGVLELIKMRQIRILDEPEDETALHRIGTRFAINDDPPPAEQTETSSQPNDESEIDE